MPIIVIGLYFFDSEFLRQLVNMGYIIWICMKLQYSCSPCIPVGYCELCKLTLQDGVCRQSLVIGYD